MGKPKKEGRKLLREEQGHLGGHNGKELLKMERSMKKKDHHYC